MNLLRLLLWAGFFVGTALAGDRAFAGKEHPEYRTVFESANSELRTAASYLRTGNVDFAALALEEFTRVWNEFRDNTTTNSSQDAPDIKVISRVSDDAKMALNAIDAGETDKARTTLLSIRDQLWVMHRDRRLVFFEDCIWKTVRVALPLWGFRKAKPDLSETRQADAVTKSARQYLEALEDCESRAPSDVTSDDRFRRLIDNAKHSLMRVPEAVATQDGGLLYRLLIELRSIDRLLYFRFG